MINTNIVATFWAKEQAYAEEHYGSENSFNTHLNNKYGVQLNLSQSRRAGRLLNPKYIESFEPFLTDDERFMYMNYICDQMKNSEEVEDFASDYLLTLNISQELKEFTRIKRRQQRTKMVEAIDRGE